MTDTPYTIADVLKHTDYGLDIFTPEEIDALTFFEKREKPYLRDLVDATERLAKPEEVVRQLFLHRLIHKYRYPRDRIARVSSVLRSSLRQLAGRQGFRAEDVHRADQPLLGPQKPQQNSGARFRA